jgi:flagellar protein FliS
MTGNAHNQYLKTKVMTASKEQLVLMLFDGVLRFSEEAKAAWQEKDIEGGHNAMVKAQKIVLELAYSLDKEKGGEIAANLASLYTYCYSRLVTASVERSSEIVDEVQKLIEEIREGWEGAMAQVASETDAADNSAVIVESDKSQAPAKAGGVSPSAVSVNKSAAASAAPVSLKVSGSTPKSSPISAYKSAAMAKPIAAARSASAKDTTPDSSKVLAKIPITKVPADQAIDGSGAGASEERPRLSVQG